jgi:hypothetical protein
MILFAMAAPKCASGRDVTPAGSVDPIPNSPPPTPMVESPTRIRNADVNTQSPPPTGGPPLSNSDGVVDFSPTDIEMSECAVQARPSLTLPSSQPDTSDHDTGAKRHRSASATSSHHSPQLSNAPAFQAGKARPEDLLMAATPSPEESRVLRSTQPDLATSAAPGGRQELGNDMMQAQSSHKRRRVVNKPMQGVYKQETCSVYIGLLTRIIDLPMPNWLQVQMKRLKAMNLGSEWEKLLETWLELERAHGFKGAVSIITLLCERGCRW